MILETLNSPEDIKKLSPKDYQKLAKELRLFLIRKTAENGGHLASNLGTVELTMALFIALDLPKDKVIWDVGHQSYTYKILSGRKDAFDDLRKFGGISGFPKTKESPYDAFNTGHSSTSISAALGMAQARDLKGTDETIAAIIGDGSLTGGMAFEALNNASRMKKNFIIILNDNNMSIAKNVGGMSNYLNGIRTDEGYIDFKNSLAEKIAKIPKYGQDVVAKMKSAKDGIKRLIVPGMLFEDMGITYLGPVDGHDVNQLVRAIKDAKRVNHAVLIHVVTTKGKGYKPAENNPAMFHGVGAFDPKSGLPLKEKTAPDYTDIFSDTICELARTDKDIVTVTAAMPDGTGLSRFACEYPERFFDVGIAEAHAVTSAAGMAAAGLKPVVAVYSSFLQRGFDQIVHDVCLQNLHVVFAVDRAGLVGADGETHQGIFDLSFLTCIPNMTVLAPKNADELKEDIRFAIDYSGPVAVRYPRGKAYDGLKEYLAPVEFGKAEMIYEEKDTAILALGSMVSTGEHVREKIKARGESCSLVNMRFAKPVDLEMVDHIAKNHKRIITMEENVLTGGMGQQIAVYVHEKYSEIEVIHIAIPDGYVEHGDVSLLRAELGIDSDSIMRKLYGE